MVRVVSGEVRSDCPHLLRSTHHQLFKTLTFYVWDAVTCAG